MWSSLALLVSVLGAVGTSAQGIGVQTDTFNSSVKFTKAQKKASGLDEQALKDVATVLNFERSNWAGGSVSQSFYTVPKNTAHLAPGSLLKMENVTDTGLYTVPPNVALSRFLFQSETLNGTAVPASAYILWPYVNRKFLNVKGVPVVAWGHGNSGYLGECAPSHIRDLWYQFSGPYELALNGYAVVAPDYAGLGVDKDSEGKTIYSQWLAGPAQGNDLIHAVQAARVGWPELSQEFVVFGHSQGGGAAWGAAERQARSPVPGYLGTIAGSPVTNLTLDAVEDPSGLYGFLTGLALSVKTVFPQFKYSDFLNQTGIDRLKFTMDIQGCNAATTQLESYGIPVKPNYLKSTPYYSLYSNMAAVGDRPFAGPMLVLQGTADTAVDPAHTTAQVAATCKNYPGDLNYLLFKGVDHVPVMYASQVIWLDWIADRFKGYPVQKGCPKTLIEPLKKVSHYQKEINFFLEYAAYDYELN